MIEMPTLAPSDTMQAFIAAVNHRMEEQSLNKSQLARAAGMHVETLRALLNGRGGSCSFATADRIAEALGTTTYELLTPKSPEA